MNPIKGFKEFLGGKKEPEKQEEPMEEPEPRPPGKMIESPFGVRRQFFLTQKDANDMIDGPLLMLIRENRTAEFFEGIRSGPLEIDLKSGDKIKVLLTPDKLISVRWGSSDVLMWVQYERETCPYPTDVKMDSLANFKWLFQIMTNYKDFETAKMKGIGSLIWIIAGALAIILLVIFLFAPPSFWAMISGKAAEEAAVVVAQNVTG